MRVAVPIIKLTFAAEDAYPNEIVEVFERAGVWNPEETHTFTGRVSVPIRDSASDAVRTHLRAELRKILPAEDADRLIGLLDEYGWDVSFYVDTY